MAATGCGGGERGAAAAAEEEEDEDASDGRPACAYRESATRKQINGSGRGEGMFFWREEVSKRGASYFLSCAQQAQGEVAVEAPTWRCKGHAHGVWEDGATRVLADRLRGKRV